MIVLNINAAKYIIILFKGQAVLLPIVLSFEWIGSFGGIKAEIALMFIFVSRLIAFTFLLSQSCALFKFQIIVINPLNVVYTIQPSPKGMSQHFSSHSWSFLLTLLYLSKALKVGCRQQTQSFWSMSASAKLQSLVLTRNSHNEAGKADCFAEKKLSRRKTVFQNK